MCGGCGGPRGCRLESQAPFQFLVPQALPGCWSLCADGSLCPFMRHLPKPGLLSGASWALKSEAHPQVHLCSSPPTINVNPQRGQQAQACWCPSQDPGQGLAPLGEGAMRCEQAQWEAVWTPAWSPKVGLTGNEGLCEPAVQGTQQSHDDLSLTRTPMAQVSDDIFK